MKILFSFILFFIGYVGIAQKERKGMPIPSKLQLQWHNMEFYLFVHFGPNTFTNKEWGLGTEPENVFNPSQLDCRQWCKIAKAAGAKGIIITAKHHDGFCLWPSKYSTHTIRESKWKNGQGDVLKELSLACKEYGLKFGIYISPWDRNHPAYGTANYNDVFVGMLKELLQNYAPVWELWWDGANGELANGKKQTYDWNKFIATVNTVSPNTLIFSDVGPDIRWVGNENGIASTTNWNLLDTVGFTPGIGAPLADTLFQGNKNGKNWIPAECDVSIRPGWFYHANEDAQVKTASQLFNLYLKSVGRGANLLLNVPPAGNGLISPIDSLSLIEFNRLIQKNFSNNLLKHAMQVDKIRTSKSADRKTELGSIFILKQPTNLNCLVLREDIAKGQLIENASIILSNQGVELKRIDITTIGHKRIITFPAMDVSEVSVVITSAKAKPHLGTVEGYLLAEDLIEK